MLGHRLHGASPVAQGTDRAEPELPAAYEGGAWQVSWWKWVFRPGREMTMSFPKTKQGVNSLTPRRHDDCCIDGGEWRNASLGQGGHHIHVSLLFLPLPLPLLLLLLRCHFAQSFTPG